MRAIPVISSLLVLLGSAEAARSSPMVTASTKEIIKLSRMGHLLASQIVAFTALMLEANMTVVCSALVVFGSPRYCDCLQCLKAETHFRQKYCRFGELVRGSERVRHIHNEVMEISGVDHLSTFLADDFYRMYCDLKECPSVPQKCCSPQRDLLRVKTSGCPLCLPVDHRYRLTCPL